VHGAVFVVLSALAGVASATLAWRQVRRVDGALGADPGALALALKRVPAERRIEELEKRAAPGSWAHEVAREVRAAPGDAAKVAAVNLALDDVEHALVEGAGWPGAGLRIALLGAALFAFAGYLASGREITWSLASVGVGAVAALTCLEAGRSAKRRTEKLRRDVDALVASAFGELDAGPEPRRTPRVRARSRGRSR
jgi:Flp pilus assembly protein TadB